MSANRKQRGGVSFLAPSAPRPSPDSGFGRGLATGLPISLVLWALMIAAAFRLLGWL